MRSGLRLLMAGIGLALVAATASAAPSEPKPFVAHVVDRVVARLGDDVDDATRGERFRAMMDRYLAFDSIAKFVTGPYWAEASDDGRAAFREAFRELLGARFLPALGKAGDVDVEIVGKRTLRDRLWSVTVQVTPAGATEATRVQLRVTRRNGDMRIADVVTQGISLGVTLREEYTSYLKRHGGDLHALADRVRGRAEDLRE